MCLYPRLIRNPKYGITKKNGGIVPPVSDTRVLHVPLGCGKCMECRKQKAREWQVRLLEDIRENKNGKFITLTFSNENYTNLVNHIQSSANNNTDEPSLQGYALDNAVATQAVRWFLERWRKEYKKSLRHWLVTELGHRGTENIHLHGIVWTDDISKLDTIWKYGYVWKGYYQNDKLKNYVNEKTVNYITKYVSKMDLTHKTYKAKILTSSGIGRTYFKRTDVKRNKYISGGTEETYRTRTGHKVALPKYFRNNIYNDDEKEKLWIEKLNKQERWINGEKVDISKGMDTYYKLLDWHRQQNRQLGYGSDNDWKREEYEYHRRLLVQEKRILPPAALPGVVNSRILDVSLAAHNTEPAPSTRTKPTLSRKTTDIQSITWDYTNQKKL